jgi:cytochrome c biogenesis protein CcdA/thiol-disulfide isomerase/thioredoxin
MISHLLALGAGLATAGSPCILPMLPLLLAASVAPAASGVAHAGSDARSPAPSRWRPLAIVLGFVAAFSAAAWLLGASARVLGVPPQHWRTGAIVVMLGMGLMLLWPSLLARLMQPLGGLADVAHRLGQRAGAGLLGGVLLGMSLGLLWTPCAGPVLASVLALIATEPQAPQALGLLVAYALGAGLPMLALAYGGQAVLARTRGLMRHAERVRQAFGAMVVLTAAAMWTGADVRAAAWLSRSVSLWPVDAWAGDSVGGGAIGASVRESGNASSRSAPVPQAAPPLVGIAQWLNSPPLNLDKLRGHVVLVEFWTFACVNCLHTVPHIERWHRRFQSQGLVVIGVHTPEFAFERDPAQVRAAVARLGISYPVALDNDYATWQAWHNAAWPALYLIDTQGRIVWRHVGEGDDALIEARIQALLQAAQAPAQPG